MAVRLHYYDVLLLAIGASVAIGVTVGLVTTLPLQLTVIIAAILGLALTAHGLFIRGPVDSINDLGDEMDVGPRQR